MTNLTPSLADATAGTGDAPQQTSIDTGAQLQPQSELIKQPLTHAETHNTLIEQILQREGREFTNRKNDKGGPTKFGITQKTLSAWRGQTVTVDDVKNLEEDEARQIYASEYVRKSAFGSVAEPLRSMLIDWAITSGEDDPAKALQKLLNEYGAELKVDGVFGPKSRAALETFIQQWGMNLVYNKIIDARVIFYARVVEKRPADAENIEGWIIRALSFRKY